MRPISGAEALRSSVDTFDAIIAAHRDRDGPLLPILHDIQATFGAVDEAAKRHVAEALNLTRAEVHGVVSFYHDFRDTPAERPVVKLCRAEACQARGAEALAAKAEALAAGRAVVEPVYCLGLCAIGPAAMVGTTPYARLDETAFARLVEEL
ncbi:NAD(P)H-dependent oxidoreductase subunit E [Acuticoccus sp. M5D2P5]|uniref:NAD(P)H-dependent oxidoreductase subunit E n=1 Tax=Acuticoccus kalidii TaxID=2910977 RepID=UPI001F161358|nr:NAD(P)H-dependent oxidoreductase subunit E [Acuticoccus kalidii]MCF3932414.1 NAD(P)H-dependent oxidoreductase subunit E [Acuticoccus kalidii]